jgi:F0F1-type ATP synthase membrane subunit a
MFDSISFFSHLVPQGTPLVLGMFLSLIELIRNFIRPLTLSLRLGIKVTTGHILLGLIRILGVQFSFKIFLVILASFYFLFELFVMFIQAIVYTLLISQYSEETLK